MNDTTSLLRQMKIALLFLVLGICLGCSEDSTEPRTMTDEDLVETGDQDSEDMEENAESVVDAFGLTWIRLPAGEYDMGCSLGDETCDDVEKPRHHVNLEGFSITQTEITQGQFVAFLNDHGNDCIESECIVADHPSLSWNESEKVWRVEDGFEHYPQAEVSWYGAKAFCEWVGGRLPSEAEWEYAARGGTTTKYYCGDDASCLDDIAWYWDNSENGTHPVAQKDPNAFDLYDMSGNVWEWVEDCFHDNYENAPENGQVWEDGNCLMRVLRGGSWDEDGGTEWTLRVSRRGSYFPTAPDDDGGFRCVSSVAE